MRSNRYVILFLFGIQFFAMQAQNNGVRDTDIVVPLFGREKLQKIKEVKSLKKYLIARLEQYKRCLVTGPCTKKEMDELWQDIKRTAYATIAILASIYVLRRFYKRVEESGQKPHWFKFPKQYYDMRKEQATELKEDIKKGYTTGKKLIKTVEGVATGETQVKLGTPVGEITGSLSPTAPRRQVEAVPQKGWGETLRGYVPAVPSVPSFFPTPSEYEPEEESPVAPVEEEITQVESAPEKSKGWWGYVPFFPEPEE